jgi:hypothetical protein
MIARGAEMPVAPRAERRHAPRVNVNIPTLVEVIGQREVQLHPNLAEVYERVQPNMDALGKKFPAAIKDLSTNGAFIAGVTLPLLSRVDFTFALPNFGQIEVLGWVMWRRSADCEVPQTMPGRSLRLPQGFGVLFEAISLEARQAINQMVVEKGGT